jgi:hypothetical protein
MTNVIKKIRAKPLNFSDFSKEDIATSFNNLIETPKPKAQTAINNLSEQ